jgi:hypothetical protein
MIFIFKIFLRFIFVYGASPGSAGCFKKVTETPNAGHPIYILKYKLLMYKYSKIQTSELPNSSPEIEFLF